MLSSRSDLCLHTNPPPPPCVSSPLICHSRFLRDPGGEPVVEPVHQHPAPWQAHVRPVRGPAGERRARPPAETDHDALRQSVSPAHPALRQHGRVQTFPNHGPCGGGRWVGTRIVLIKQLPLWICREPGMILYSCSKRNEWNFSRAPLRECCRWSDVIRQTSWVCLVSSPVHSLQQWEQEKSQGQAHREIHLW